VPESFGQHGPFDLEASHSLARLSQEASRGSPSTGPASCLPQFLSRQRSHQSCLQPQLDELPDSVPRGAAGGLLDDATWERHEISNLASVPNPTVQQVRPAPTLMMMAESAAGDRHKPREQEDGVHYIERGSIGNLIPGGPWVRVDIRCQK
jgi:hypothetical protein